MWTATRGINDELRNQSSQVETTVEPVGKSTQVTRRILGELERMERPTKRRLEVAEYGIDPGELGKITRLALADNDGAVRAADCRYCSETCQPVARDRRARNEVRRRPRADRKGGEPGDLGELDMPRVPQLIERYRGNERDFVLRAATDLATAALAPEIGIVELDRAVKSMLRLFKRHGVHDLVVHQPSCRIAHAKMTLERQGRQASLGLADQVHRKEPGCQRQFRAGKHGARSQGSLKPTGIALEQFASTVAHNVVRRTVAARASKTRGPTCTFDGLRALRFRPEAAHELRQGHAVLKLNLIHRHGEFSVLRSHQTIGVLAHGVS